MHRKYSKPRQRKPNNVIEEIESWLNKSNNPDRVEFNIVAENIFFSKNYFKEFIELLVNKNIKNKFFFDIRADFLDSEDINLFKEINTFAIFIGCEFWNQEELNFYNKGTTVENNLKIIDSLYKSNIWYVIGSIYFHPYSNIDLFLKNLKISYQIGWEHFPNVYLFGKLKAFKSTIIAEKIIKDHLLKEYDLFFIYYNYLDYRIEALEILTKYYQSEMLKVFKEYKDIRFKDFLENKALTPPIMFFTLAKELKSVKKNNIKNFTEYAKKELNPVIIKRKKSIRRILDVTTKN